MRTIHRLDKAYKNAHHDVFEVLKKFFYHGRMRIIYGNHNIFLKDKNYVKDNYYRYYGQYKEQTYDFLKGLELNQGKISIVSWKIRVNRDGLLQGTRRVIRGPDPIEKFDLNIL